MLQVPAVTAPTHPVHSDSDSWLGTELSFTKDTAGTGLEILTVATMEHQGDRGLHKKVKHGKSKKHRREAADSDAESKRQKRLADSMQQIVDAMKNAP